MASDLEKVARSIRWEKQNQLQGWPELRPCCYRSCRDHVLRLCSMALELCPGALKATLVLGGRELISQSSTVGLTMWLAV